MQQVKQTRWGIIGLGNIANTFASDLAFVPNAILHAVASRDLNKAEAFKTTYAANKAYSSYETLAKDPDIDIIYIATPHVFHFENAKLCITYGKAVLCEKPMGMNANQVTELCDLAKKNKVFLMEAMWTAFLPNFNRLMELVDSEKLGKVISFKADFGFKADFIPTSRLFDKNLGGGSILDIGIYPIFACLSLLKKPTSITTNAIIGQTGVDESCIINFNYPKSLKAELKSTLLENTPTEIYIQFEQGVAILGPNFYGPSDLKVIESDGNEIIYPKNTQGSGYQFEATHVQELFHNKNIESSVMSHAKSIELATYLDIVLQEIGVIY
ncbi:Gfo/Idh/MocA family protein [Aquimarina agarilytica]|uniref:Gfo/Idh/MocA family protein n=1 Tax=Aquimarina agarilytica TaxID=1087449 RepID=UPI000289DFC5|nr:Gfo/Idh/MocA family oxidoreductase [Aquimarina agarilytica]